MKPYVHLFTGFLGTGKTSALRDLMAQKPHDQSWLIIVNEFGEIGIDGAVLSDNGIPVAEISGGCLCCTGGAQMSDTLRTMLSQYQPQRILIEASGLAHAAGIIDELKTPEFRERLNIAAVFTLIDPRQFIQNEYAQNPLYADQIGVCDVLIANKTDLCTPETLAQFHERAAQLFPPKALIATTEQAHMNVSWLNATVVEKPRYRPKVVPENTLGYQSQGYTFDANKNFDGERLSAFFDVLPHITQDLVRAKGVFRVLDTWVWLNWSEGQWGANQVAWRRDSRFELIARHFDTDDIEQRLQAALE